MIKFTYNGANYEICFRYGKIEKLRGIYCTIYSDSAPPKDLIHDENAIAQSQSRCATADHFVKETGRKIALARALARPFNFLRGNSDFTQRYWSVECPPGFDPKAFRTAAWKAYLRRKNHELDKG